MSNGDVASSAGGDVTARATGNVILSVLSGNATFGDVIVEADADAGQTEAGNITDGLVDEGAGNINVIANRAVFLAFDGVGSGNDIDTTTNFVAAVTEQGNIEITNVGNLTISRFFSEGVIGVSVTDSLSDDNSGGDNIIVRATSPLTVNDAVTNSDGGEIILAAEGNTTADILTINANIDANGGSGNISLFAGGNVHHNLGNVTAAGTGVILVSAGENYNGGVNANGSGNADVIMAGNVQVASTGGTGQITVRATRDVALSIVNAGTGNVFITADFDGVAGGLANGNGEIRDNTGPETANVLGNTGNFTAATGIGNVDDIDTALNNVLATNTFTGNINITETAAGVDLTILGALMGNVAGGNIHIATAAGNLTVTGEITNASTVPGTIFLTSGGGGNIAVNGNVTSTGGRIRMNATGNYNQSAGDVNSRGGNIDIDSVGTFLLAVGGNIISTGNVGVDSGNITIDTAAANATVTIAGNIISLSTGNAAGRAGSGGDVEITTQGDGANILFAGGTISVNGGFSAGGIGGNAGDITLRVNGNATSINAPVLAALGGAGNRDGGRGGNIVISTFDGNITTTTITTDGGSGNLVLGNGGIGGSFTITAGGEGRSITIGGVINALGGNAELGGNGGSGRITATGNASTITVNSAIDTSGGQDPLFNLAGGNAGLIRIETTAAGGSPISTSTPR